MATAKQPVPWHTIVWRCKNCKLCGAAPIDRHSVTSIVDFDRITASIAEDHAQRSPQCKTGDKEIEILPEEKEQ
jgi:hypothetical protein